MEPGDTIEAWAVRYVGARTFAEKLAPSPAPLSFAKGALPDPPAAPGRGPEFRVSTHAAKSTGKSALASELARARLLHTFLHHELQAAELMAWAIVRFPDAPEALRRGLLGIFSDEVRHMNLYADLVTSRGHALGSFEVRDWFWERIPKAPSIVSYLATMGLGFEGANLDHTVSFADRFARHDEEAARAIERVGRDEVGHVRFALTWFRELSPEMARGASLFEAFQASLPPPLSPLVMKGKVLARELRARAGLDEAFLEGLGRWTEADLTRRP